MDTKRSPLLDPSSLNYFSTDEEYKNLPEYTETVFARFEFSWSWTFMLLMYLARQYFLLVVVRLTSEYHLMFTTCSLVLMATIALCAGLRNHTKPVSPCLLFIISAFDVAFYFIIIHVAGTLSPLTVGILMQAPVVIIQVLLIVVEKERFKLTQYIGSAGLALCIVGACVRTLQWDIMAALLGVLLWSIAYMIKMCYVRTFLSNASEMNKYTLISAAAISVIVTGAKVYQHDPEEYLEGGGKCLFLGECQFAVCFLVGLGITGFLHLATVNFYRREPRVHSQAAVVRPLLTLLGFYLAGLSTGSPQPTWLEAGIAGLAVIFSIVYSLFPESPPGISLSDD